MSKKTRKHIPITTHAGICITATLFLPARAFAEDVVAIDVPAPGILALITAAVAVAGLIYRNRRK